VGFCLRAAGGANTPALSDVIAPLASVCVVGLGMCGSVGGHAYPWAAAEPAAGADTPFPSQLSACPPDRATHAAGGGRGEGEEGSRGSRAGWSAGLHTATHTVGGDMVKIDLRAIEHYKAQDERV
jgi:hypothetical protein